MTRIATPPTARQRRPARLPYEEFLKRYSGGQHVEWVNGEVVQMPAVSDQHDDIFGFLYTGLRHFAEFHKLGRVLSDPFQMKPAAHLPGRAPDIQFVAKRHLKRIRPLFVDGPADLVVEIVSASSRTIDRVNKFREYEAGGVREYWIIDPEQQLAEFYVRGRGGKFQPVEPDTVGRYESKVMAGLWIDTAWLWDPPALLVVLKAWGII